MNMIHDLEYGLQQEFGTTIADAYGHFFATGLRLALLENYPERVQQKEPEIARIVQILDAFKVTLGNKAYDRLPSGFCRVIVVDEENERITNNAIRIPLDGDQCEFTLKDYFFVDSPIRRALFQDSFQDLPPPKSFYTTPVFQSLSWVKKVISKGLIPGSIILLDEDDTIVINAPVGIAAPSDLWERYAEEHGIEETEEAPQPPTATH